MTGEITYTIPVAGVTPGPNYAVNVSDALTVIQTHNHDGLDDGSQIDISKQVISQDLQLDGYNIGTVRSLEMESQPSQLTGEGDVNCLYVNQNNLGFNNSNGVFVPITSGNTLAIGALTFTNFSVRTIVSSATILATDTYNCVDVNASGALTITLPIAGLISPIPAGRLFLIRDTNFTAGTNTITIQVTPASGNTFATGATSIEINNNGGYIGVYTDGVSKWFIWTQNVYSTSEIINYNGVTITETGGAHYFVGETINIDSTSVVTNNAPLGQNGDASFNGNAYFNSPVVFGIVATLHTTAAIYATSQTTTFQSCTIDLISSSQISANNTTICSFAGALNGSGINTFTGTTSIASPTISGGMTLSGGGAITGNVSFNSGTITVDDNINFNSSTLFTNTCGWNIHTNSFIQMDNSSVLEVDGLFKNYGPNRIGVTLISYGTYNINPATDNYIAVDTSLSGLTTVNMPATPSTGDTYAIGDAADNLGSATILLQGNGHNFFLPGGSSSYTYPHTNGLCLRWVFANNCWVQVV